MDYQEELKRIKELYKDQEWEWFENAIDEYCDNFEKNSVAMKKLQHYLNLPTVDKKLRKNGVML